MVAPDLYQISARKNRTVRKALNEGKWIADLGRKISKQHLGEFVRLLAKLVEVVLIPDIPEDITWKLTPSGDYTSKSAYEAQFLGSINRPFQHFNWKPRESQKCKIFA